MSGPVRIAALAALAALLAACAAGPQTPLLKAPEGARAPGVPAPAAPGSVVSEPALPRASQIHVPQGVQAVLRLRASGNQIFRCEARGAGFGWVFRLPEADLTDEAGQPAGRHGANYSFELPDGSRTVGAIVAHDPAPGGKAVAWLLISARSFGKGLLTDVAWIQRIDTEGGMPPASCDSAQAGQLLRVPFSATFVFYR
jgi:hypothetical protein